MATTADPGFNEGVRRLAQYRPFDQAGEGLAAVLRDLAVSAAEINGGAFSALSECQAGFKALWDIEVEVDEIRKVRDALIADAIAVRAGGGFALTDTTRADLRARSQESDELEKRALDQWEEDVRALRADLTFQDFECLRLDLRTWLSKIVARHGAEAALMLYPEYERAHQLFEEIERAGTTFLEKRSEAVMSVREEALKRFVRQPSPEQRTFLANRLNTAFYLTVLTLDPAAQELAQAKARGIRVYLDTNFLYAVLGMANADEVYAAERLLRLTADLGYQIAITRWTVQELRASIERARRNVEIQGQPFSPGLARLMVQVTGEKGFTRSYWREFLKGQVTPKDFFERVAAFEEDLPGLGIDIVDEGCHKIDARKELVQDYCSLLGKLVTRDPHVIEHDAKHRLLVEQLRGDGNIRFSTAKCWFLTQDTKLPTYAALVPDMESDDPPHLPFCISPSSWVQIVRAMTARTEDFDRMVVELLASPHVGFVGPVNQKAVNEVVARMDQYKDASPELALSVVQDTALMESVAHADAGEVAEQVERAYSTKARQLKEQAAASAQIAADAASAREESEGRERRAREDLEAEVQRREGLESDVERLRRERREETAARDIELRTEEERRRGLEDRLRTEAGRRKRRLRVAAGSVLGLLGTGGVAAVVLMGLVAAPLALVAVLLGGALVLGVGINVALGEKWGGAVLSVVGLVLGVAGVVIPPLLEK